jgi:hypothetical protein
MGPLPNLITFCDPLILTAVLSAFIPCEAFYTLLAKIRHYEDESRLKKLLPFLCFSLTLLLFSLTLSALFGMNVDAL